MRVALLAARMSYLWGTFLFAYMREARMPSGGAILSCMLFFQTFFLGDEWIPAMPIWLAVSKKMDPTLTEKKIDSGYSFTGSGKKGNTLEKAVERQWKGSRKAVLLWLQLRWLWTATCLYKRDQ